MARSYRELLVWQKAKLLAVRIYQRTEQFPRSEIYGLTSQMRRAGVSVASNIAEGQGSADERRVSTVPGPLSRLSVGIGHTAFYCFRFGISHEKRS